MPKFDAVILGAGLSGCALAAMLAKAGKRVIIMDPAAVSGGSASSVDVQGNHISGWPDCAYGFEDGGAWSLLLRDLGLQGVDAVHPASYQVALPGRRITVSPEAGATLSELGREYPEEIDALTRFYRDVASLEARLSRSRISAFLARRRRAADLLGSYRFSRELVAFFSASSAAFFGIPVLDMSVAQLVMLVTKPPRRVRGRFDALCRELCEYVTRRGGECRLNEPWPEMLVRRSRLEGVRVAGERIDSGVAILNIPWRVRHRALYSLVREEVLPVGMLDTVLAVDDYDHPDLSMMLSLAPSIPGRGSGGSLRPLRALFPEQAATEGTPDRMINAVSRVVPFLADFTEATSFRDCSERDLSGRNNDPLTRRPIPSVGTLPLLRVPVRTIYVLEDTPFGQVQQANAVRDLASRLS